MARRERPRDRGGRRANEVLRRLGREAREARRTCGLSQAAVADAVRLSRQYVSRFELGHAPGIALRHVFQILAVVGLDLWARTYPAGDGTRDEASLVLQARLHEHVAPSVGWETEVPLPLPGDPRAWDVLLRFPDARWGLETETRIEDVQDRTRAWQRKRRDGGVDGMILLLADTAHHRALVARHQPLFDRLFPEHGASAMAALRAGHAPAADALVLL